MGMPLEKAQDNTASNNIPTLPARLYHDAEFYEAERQAIFFNQWLVYAHESLFDEPGKHLTRTMAGWPVFVIRGKDGALKAFHNVCRHRAANILREGHGKADILRCMYHGWVYDTDGQLRRAPNFGGDEKALCDHTALFPVHVRTWNGLVFICMGENPPSFDEALGDLPVITSDINLPGFKFHSMASHDLKCNWKTYVENYLEGYHIPTIHPELNKELDMATYEVRTGQRIAQHLSQSRVPDGVIGGLWAWLWPNAMLNIYKTGMNLELVIPTGPETMTLSYAYYFRDISPEAETENRRTIETSFAITQEDIEICELVQKNLRAGIYDRGELSPKHEGALAYFQDLVRRTSVEA
jgi:choline monooxygenase